MDNNEPQAITELRHRVALAEELAGSYDNRTNHKTGKFLREVLHAYDELKRALHEQNTNIT